MQVAILGLDIAEYVFLVHGTGRHGGIVLRHRLLRQEVIPFFANLTSCLVDWRRVEVRTYSLPNYPIERFRNSRIHQS